VIRSSAWALSLFALAACSSSTGSSAGGPGAGDDLDGAVGLAADGAADTSMSSGSDDSGDASPGATEGGGSSGGGAVATGTAAAGKAGADAFCTQICDHEQHCAEALDASTSGVAGCLTSCQSANESSTSDPPTELLRADYVTALGSCIASSSCDVALATAEADCATDVVTGSDGGTPISASAAAMAFCHALATSPCGPDAGAQSCVSSIALYSDTALSAATACFSMSSCTDVDSCYAAAFAQS
jgi:hypothetical protein